MAEVIHVRPEPDGHIRVSLADGFSGTVVAHVPGRVYDHTGTHLHTLSDGRTETRTHEAGDPAEESRIVLAGQERFIVPGDAASLTFDDGTTVDLAKFNKKGA